MTQFDLKRYLQERKEEVERGLVAYLPREDDYPPLLHRAMHYSIFAGGKRVRPILHLGTVEATGGDREACLPFACALEMIHTYSLIHDDLPAMDDDDLRRGKPTNHVVFGEAVAILAGDALLTEAFCLICNEQMRERLDKHALLQAIHELAQAAGSQGMAGGQTMDITMEGKDIEAKTLEYIHAHKTGALIRASVRTGAILSGASTGLLARFSRFGEALGLAFQIRDDLLNVEGDRERLGKAVGTDASRGKATYPALHGVDKTRQRLSELVDESLDALSSMDGRAEPLRAIARYMATRDH
jgi:geranylgeranyl diphosphate synthase type II